MSDHRPPLLMDTCALSKDFLKWLRTYNPAKSISSVTYMEYCIYMVGTKNMSVEEVSSILRHAGISIQPFGKHQAEYASEFMTRRTIERCRTCNKIDWNDCMVAAHAPIAPTVIVTENVKDFPYLDGRVITPNDAMKRYGRL
ncbi:MAG: PIN domain-containing protein [Methanomassiliicoccaceae archaeon]|nr:PIN domain-containing protein [Methanomassiliicoccaceae archaeon]